MDSKLSLQRLFKNNFMMGGGKASLAKCSKKSKACDGTSLSLFKFAVVDLVYCRSNKCDCLRQAMLY